MSIFKKHKKEPVEPQELNQTNEFSFRIKISNNRDSKEVILWRFMVAHYSDEFLNYLNEPNKKDYYQDNEELLAKIRDCESKRKQYESEINELKYNDEKATEFLKVLRTEFIKGKERTSSKIKAINNLREGNFDANVISELILYPDLVKIIVQREYSFFVEKFQKHINHYLKKYYKDFLGVQGLTEAEFSRPAIKDMRLEDGCLQTCFNLFVTAGINFVELYKFVYQFVERLTNYLENDFLGYYVIATAMPVYQNNPTHLTASTAENRNSSSTNPIINHIVTALILIALFAIYNIFNPSDDKIKKIVKEETDQIIKYEIPAQIEDAIYKEKVNCLFMRDFVLPSSTNIVPPTANDTVKAKK